MGMAERLIEREYREDWGMTKWTKHHVHVAVKIIEELVGLIHHQENSLKKLDKVKIKGCWLYLSRRARARWTGPVHVWMCGLGEGETQAQRVRTRRVARDKIKGRVMSL